MQRPSENQLENCLVLDGRTRCGGGWTWSWESQNCKGAEELSDWARTGRPESDERVLTGAGIFIWISLKVCFSEELSWLHLKSKQWLGAQHPWNWEVKIQAAKFKKQGKNKSKLSSRLCSEAVTALPQMLSISGVGGWVAAWVASPTGSAVLREQDVCTSGSVSLQTPNLGVCSKSPTLCYDPPRMGCLTSILSLAIPSDRSQTFFLTFHSSSVQCVELAPGCLWIKLPGEFVC